MSGKGRSSGRASGGGASAGAGGASPTAGMSVEDQIKGLDFDPWSSRKPLTSDPQYKKLSPEAKTAAKEIMKWIRGNPGFIRELRTMDKAHGDNWQRPAKLDTFINALRKFPLYRGDMARVTETFVNLKAGDTYELRGMSAFSKYKPGAEFKPQSEVNTVFILRNGQSRDISPLNRGEQEVIVPRGYYRVTSVRWSTPGELNGLGTVKSYKVVELQQFMPSYTILRNSD